LCFRVDAVQKEQPRLLVLVQFAICLPIHRNTCPTRDLGELPSRGPDPSVRASWKRRAII